MFIDFIEIENVLDNPDEIVEFAKKQNYLTKEEYNSHTKTFWRGSRTKAISILDDTLAHHIDNQIFTKCINKLYSDSSNRISYSFSSKISSFFHILTEKEIYDSSWIHKDRECIWAGVIYLNKNPKPDSGTVVYRNGEKIIVDNQYNKLVMYTPTYEHASQGGFGTNIDDGRLTITFFVNDFEFKVKSVINY